MGRKSARLQAMLDFVEGEVLADIGTDHGYLPIEAILAGKVKKALACDLSEGPLACAAENIARFGLEKRIETRLGFGLQPLRPGEADCVAIAGMGGMRMIDILQDCPKGVKRLILQPQHDVVAVRKALGGFGFTVSGERLLVDKGRVYTVILAEA